MIDRFSYDIQDSIIADILKSNLSQGLDATQPRQFTVLALDNERKRITKILNDQGYYRFNKDYIYYTADTVRGSRAVDVTLHLTKYQPSSASEPALHPRYIVGRVNVLPGDSTGLHIRREIIADNTLIEPGKYFSATDLQTTYNNLARLGAIRYTDIEFKEMQRVDSIIVGKMLGYQQSEKRYLEANIKLSSNKPNTISFQPEGTNTAGDLGAAAVLTYQNRNLFHGSELFSIELRAAFEAIKGLEGYNNHNYEEYGVQARLQFPRFLSPFSTREFRRRSNAVSGKGAVGLMQLMPGTAGDMNVTDPYNPANNLEGGIKYLSQQLSRFQNTEQALAAYNAGPQSLLRYRGQIPPYNETRQYIQRVMHYKNRYQNDWQQHIK